MSNKPLSTPRLICECCHFQENHCVNHPRFHTSDACNICGCCWFQDRDDVQKPSPRYDMCSRKGLPKSGSLTCPCQECELASILELADEWKGRLIRENLLPPDEYNCQREGLPNLAGKDCPCPTCQYNCRIKKLCEMLHRLLCEAILLGGNPRTPELSLNQ